ncbi:MAG TPA: hypothetical protein VJ965_01770, partial [Anaerolineales bacterium]|nr:hypothetical protein [Anaerolineales bacterium]
EHRNEEGFACSHAPRGNKSALSSTLISPVFLLLDSFVGDRDFTNNYSPILFANLPIIILL